MFDVTHPYFYPFSDTDFVMPPNFTKIRIFVTKTCRDIIDDVEKLDAIQDDFI